MQKARIMIVEDEELVALAIKTYLEGAGYDVPLVLSSGEEAIKRFSSAAPDLVLMDIRLDGDMSGIEAADAIRESFHTPVIYLTAYSDSDTLERAKLTEPFGYILKPFDERALLATIEVALHKSAKQNELQRTKEKMSTILQSVGEGIIVTGVTGVVEYVNSTAQSLLEISLPLPASTPVFQLFKVVDAKTHETVSLRLEDVLMEGKGVKRSNCLLVTKGERSLAVDINLEPYRDEGGTIRGMVLAFRDISERHRFQEVIDRELQSAVNLHRSLLPPESGRVGSLRLEGFLLAASFGAGDLYNYFSIDDASVGIYMADVMGHGIAATSMTLLLSRLLTPDDANLNRLTFLDADPLDPAEVIRRLNDLFVGSGGQLFFTLCYGVIDVEKHTLRLSRAGHPYPIIRRRGGKVDEVRAGGNAVGIARDSDAHPAEVAIEPGDKILFYSDGLTECTDAQGRPFSRERLLALAQTGGGDGIEKLVARIKSDVLGWRGKDSFDDDIALIAMEIEQQ